MRKINLRPFFHTSPPQINILQPTLKWIILFISHCRTRVLVNVESHTANPKKLIGMLASDTSRHYAGTIKRFACSPSSTFWPSLIRTRNHQKFYIRFEFYGRVALRVWCSEGRKDEELSTWNKNIWTLMSSNFSRFYFTTRNPKKDAIRRHRVWERYGARRSQDWAPILVAKARQDATQKPRWHFSQCFYRILIANQPARCLYCKYGLATVRGVSPTDKASFSRLCRMVR